MPRHSHPQRSVIVEVVVKAVARLSVVEPLERRQLLSGDIRSYDGTGNNLTHPEWGSAAQRLLRLANAAYADGFSAPSGGTRASARAVSNAVAAHPDDEMPNARFLSAYGYLWGQFIDHDLDLTTSAVPTESFNVAVPAGDAYFDPNNTGTQVIALKRSEYDPTTGLINARQQISDITAFIDGSMIYGSDAVRALALRTLSGGKLLASAGDLLPFNTMGLTNDVPAGPPASYYFVAGDFRANENIELTAMHTLWMREHNRLAAQIGQQNPTWRDEQIYQQARRLVIGEIQMITYNEFLPALLGPGAIPQYTGYKPAVKPGIANEFSTAAFRLGHSMLANDVEFMDNDGHDTRDEIELADAFFNPAMVQETGIDPLLKYLASSNSEEIDNKVVDGVRNFLFGQPGQGGFDLASLNIQRGRDHGLPDYNTVRAALGLPRVNSFAQISGNPAVQQALQATYGNVNSIDLWVGGLAENHLPGSSLGPTFQRIVADQFTRVRDGDRFWYQSDLSQAELTALGNVHLADVVRRNSDLTNLQPNVFVYNTTASGRVWNDRDGDGVFEPGEMPLANRRVNLFDEDGNVVASAQTNFNGLYQFSGIQIGEFAISANIPPGWRETGDPDIDIAVTRGQNFIALDFGQRQIADFVIHKNPDLAGDQHLGDKPVHDPNNVEDLLGTA
jgi:hypothetical protein